LNVLNTMGFIFSIYSNKYVVDSNGQIKRSI